MLGHATIAGSGALGGFLGARLLRAGASVTFVARGDNARVLDEEGLEIIELDGSRERFRNLNVVPELKYAPTSDIIVLGVKTWQVSALLDSLASIISPHGLVLTTQNGVDTPPQVAKAVGPERVVSGAFHLHTIREKLGLVRNGGTKTLILGEWNGGVSERLHELAKTILPKCTSTSPHVTDDIQKVLWNKMIGMAISNAVGAACRMPMGVFSRVESTFHLLRKAALEATAVAKAHGIEFPPDYVEKYSLEGYKWLDKLTLSMQRDLMEGRPSEYFEQVAAIPRLAREKNVETPVFDVLCAILLPQELLARGEISFD